MVRAAGGEAILTSDAHISGTDRVAEVARHPDFAHHDVIVNVQGDEPLIEPELINAVAQELHARPDCVMSTAAHAIDSREDWLSPHVVKVVTDQRHTALYFSRAPVPWWRDGMDGLALPMPRPLRHIGIYAYRAGFLRRFPALAASPLETTESLEQLRVLWHGERIAVHLSAHAPGPGVDTPQDLALVRARFSRP